MVTHEFRVQCLVENKYFALNKRKGIEQTVSQAMGKVFAITGVRNYFASSIVDNMSYGTIFCSF